MRPQFPAPVPAATPPPEEEQAEEACAARDAALEQPRALRTAASTARGPGLWVGERHITQAGELDLPALSRLREDVLQAMICSQSRVFWFADSNELRWTIELRVKIITLMQAVRSGRSACRFLAGGAIDVPGNWQAYPEPAGSMSGLLAEWRARGRVQFAARARHTVGSAHAAIQAFRTERSSLDCLAGMELTILDAADSVLGQANFDAFHRPAAWPHLAALDPAEAQRRYVLVGLGVPVLGIDPNVDPYRVIDNRARTSLGKHLVIVRYHVAGGERGERPLDRADDPLAGTITVDDMVPGDYAYLSNLPDYQRRAPAGILAGENAFYLGRGASGTPYFYGYGFYNESEPERNVLLSEQMLRDEMAEHYNATRPPTPARPAEMQWVRLGAPTLYGNPRHAGMFAEP